MRLPAIRRHRRPDQRGVTLVEAIIASAMVGVALTALVGLLAVLLRGTDSVSQRSIALQLARSQIESIKNQAYTSTVGAYATITPAFSEYQISLSGSEITARLRQ